MTTEVGTDATPEAVTGVLAAALRRTLALEHRATNAERRLAKARKQLRYMYETVAVRNLQLKAYYHVWCTDGSPEGVGQRPGDGKQTEVTREVVETAIRNTDRLITWYRNAGLRHEWGALDKNIKEIYHRRNQEWAAAHQREAALVAALSRIALIDAHPGDENDMLASCIDIAADALAENRARWEALTTTHDPAP